MKQGKKTSGEVQSSMNPTAIIGQDVQLTYTLTSQTGVNLWKIKAVNLPSEWSFVDRQFIGASGLNHNELCSMESDGYYCSMLANTGSTVAKSVILTYKSSSTSGTYNFNAGYDVYSGGTLSASGYVTNSITLSSPSCTQSSDCTSGGECKIASCPSGSCVYSNKADGTSCTGGTCQSGTCVLTTPNCVNNAQITSKCKCGGTDYLTGYCCNNVYQTTVCSCVPSCTNKVCGDNGCGGTCGTCLSTQTCSAGQCILSSCTPSWSCTTWSVCSSSQQTRVCSDSNNCNVLTGKPSESQSCTCVPSCASKVCGDNGCGGSCGSCLSNQTCSNGQCYDKELECEIYQEEKDGKCKTAGWVYLIGGLFMMMMFMQALK